jgi:hypothetical protein
MLLSMAFMSNLIVFNAFPAHSAELQSADLEPPTSEVPV